MFGTRATTVDWGKRMEATGWDNWVAILGLGLDLGQSSKQRLASRNRRGLIIRSAAKKPAKSPGIAADLDFLLLFLEGLAEEEWKVKRELLLEKRVCEYIEVVHHYDVTTARINVPKDLSRGHKKPQKLSIGPEEPRMMYFIQASDMGAWNVVEDGYIKPLTHPRMWSEGETRLFQLNSKAIHIIFCALGPDEYGRVSSCTTAKEIWDKFQVTHEDEVDLDKIDETPKEKEKKKNIGVTLKSTKDESDSNEDDDDEEMTLNGQSKNKHKAHVATWSDEEGFDEEEQEVANLCLMVFGEDSKGKEHCYKARETNSNSWYLDNGCSIHMTGDKNRFIELNAKNGGEMIFGDNSKGHIEGIINTNDVRHNVGEPSSKEETKDEETHDPLENPTIEEREVSYPREYNYVKDGEIIGDPSKGLMQSEFEMSMMGELSFFLGLQIKQRKDDIFINQAKYVKDMLKKFGLENDKPHDTPMSSSTKLDLDEGDKCVDVKLYTSMIGSLLYLTASRSDSMFSVCLCARFQSCPKESHLLAVKRIFRYLKDTPSLGLWYPRDSSFSLHAFSDTDYGGYKLDRKSTSGEPIPPLKGNRFPPVGESIPPEVFSSRSSQPPNPLPIPQIPIPNPDDPNMTISNSCFNKPGRKQNLYYRFCQYFEYYKIREERIPSPQAMLDINFHQLPTLHEWKFDKLFEL
ncbi:hypothetical protein F3Y22_tig00110319pilonHSYRG00279 [Hibiscus syriacus]|uniref:Uncharacterized protein n=1 Tax=Hibiscus syriacus TaxID=106335 RepID=A0A6A3B6V1_HIBSY|nr:hypothetical protein F3Y22_tig00110319pilonHSYRG00279 [Hibiscus syriacus]